MEVEEGAFAMNYIERIQEAAAARESAEMELKSLAVELNRERTKVTHPAFSVKGTPLCLGKGGAIGVET